jgi:hypothetical protein
MFEDIEVTLESAAYHEAGHMVIAAALGLKLRPEGLMVDPCGKGLACYCRQPDLTDATRKRVIVATLAGFAAESRFRDERSYDPRDELGISLSPDGCDARRLLMELPGDYSSNERELQSQLNRL